LFLRDFRVRETYVKSPLITRELCLAACYIRSTKWSGIKCIVYLARRWLKKADRNRFIFVRSRCVLDGTNGESYSSTPPHSWHTDSTRAMPFMPLHFSRRPNRPGSRVILVLPPALGGSGTAVASSKTSRTISCQEGNFGARFL